MSDISLEDILILEGLDYKTSMGARGEQLVIRECPSCGKESWKVYANAESGLGNCFSCGTNYNVWSFAKALLTYRGVPSVDNRTVGNYLNDIRKKLGYRPTTRAVISTPKVETTCEINLPTSQRLPYSDGWVHPYLLRRRIDGHYSQAFDLRYSSFGSWAYKDDQGQTHTQSFAERIIIPVYDLDGRLVTFQGRDCSGASEVRYKFAGGLPGTARFLYNGHTAYARRARRVIMGEGAFDVIGIQRALDQDLSLSDTVPVGSWGKHLSVTKEGDDQLGAFMRLKQNGLEEVVCLYDGEDAAYREAIKAAQLLTTKGLKTSVAILPPGVDPGDADTAVILGAIHKAIPYNRINGLRLQMAQPYPV